MVGVEVSPQIQPRSISDISGKHALFKRDLPRKVEQPVMVIQMTASGGSPQPTPQLGAVVFDSVREDGTIARALTVNPNQILYATSKYDRWAEFQPLSERLITEVALLALGDEQRVNAVVLSAANRFVWRDGSHPARLDSLLASGTGLIADHCLALTQQVHSFHGFVEIDEANVNEKMVQNVNVQTGDTDDGLRVADINLSYKIMLSADCGFPRMMFGNRAVVFRKICSEMHDRNDNVFSRLLLPEIRDLIPGLPG